MEQQESKQENDASIMAEGAAKSRQIYDMYSLYQYPWMGVNFLLLLWLASQATRAYLERTKRDFGKTFLSLNEDRKRNVVIYIVQFFGTTLCFAVQCYGAKDILFRYEDITSPHRIQSVYLSTTIIVVIYLWELIYRLSIGSPLLVHHLMTILLCQLGTASSYDTEELYFLRFVLLLGFHATTEQISFVALLFYRLNICPKLHKWLFLAAAVQAFFFKSIATILLLWQLGINVKKDFRKSPWHTFLSCAVGPLSLGLYAAQLYSCRILIALCSRCNRKRTVESGDTHNETDSERRLKTRAVDIDEDENTWADSPGNSPCKINSIAFGRVSEQDCLMLQEADGSESQHEEQEEANTTTDIFHSAARLIGDKNVIPVGDTREATNEDRLRLYGLYKRGTIGRLLPPYDVDDDIETAARPRSRPSHLKYVAQRKYDAWRDADSMTKQEAQIAYIALVEELVGEPLRDLKREKRMQLSKQIEGTTPDP